MATSPADAADAASSGSAFPQLNFELWPTQIFWLVVTITALYFILSRFALPRISATLEERQDTIASDLDKAAEFDTQAKEAEAAYHQALQTARGEAQKIAEKTRNDIKAQLSEAMAKADEQIAARAAASTARLEAIRAESAEKAREVAQSTAQALVEKFSPKPVDAAALNAAVASGVAARFGG